MLVRMFFVNSHRIVILRAVRVDGETEPEGDSPTADSLCPEVKPQAPLRCAPAGMTISFKTR